MAFVKGARESPGMVVRLGENPRQGRAGSTMAYGQSEAKDLIFGDPVPQPAGRQNRPPLQPANSKVDVSTGPPVTLLRSKVGPGRQRRQPDDMEVDNIKRFQEEAMRGYQDARQARQQTRDTQGKMMVKLGFEQSEDSGSNGNTPKHERSGSRRPSRERTMTPTQVDPEMAELLGRIEMTAELERVDARASEVYWDAQAAAEKSRARNYRGSGAGGGGIFGDGPAEEEPFRGPAEAFGGAPRQPQGPADEARLAREKTLARNRGQVGGIFAVDPPLPAPPARDFGNDIMNHRRQQ